MLAGTWAVTAPCAAGVTGNVKVVPLPERVPRVPLVTEISAAVRPVTASENVIVNVMGELFVAVPDGVTDTVGAAVSTVTLRAPESALRLPAASVAVAVML